MRVESKFTANICEIIRRFGKLLGKKKARKAVAYVSMCNNWE